MLRLNQFRLPILLIRLQIKENKYVNSNCHCDYTGLIGLALGHNWA